MHGDALKLRRVSGLVYPLNQSSNGILEIQSNFKQLVI